MLSSSSMEKWQSITQREPVVEFLRGLFERVGIEVTDAGEQFTCCHTGSRITFKPGIKRARVDFTVPVQSFQVDRLAEHAQRGRFDAAEQYRIVSTMFTPATASLMKNPVLSNPIVRWLSGAESLIHVHLLSPVPDEKNVVHTLVYVARQWLVFPGEHGFARRIYMLNVEEALRYQRHVFAAVKANTFSSWLAFSQWYRRWRETVSADTH